MMAGVLVDLVGMLLVLALWWTERSFRPHGMKVVAWSQNLTLEVSTIS